MLAKINKEKAILELLYGNENIYIKGYEGDYLKAIYCIFRFKDYGEGYDLNTVTFYIELED